MGYIICLAIGAAAGFWAGIRYGGLRALYRLGQFEYGERRRRAKL